MTAIVETITAVPGADVGGLLTDLLKIVTDAATGTAGWLVSLGALSLLLVRVSKLPVLDRWLSSPVWLRPAMSAGLGALGGFISGFALGGLPKALIGVVTGAVSGLAAVGAHQLGSRITAEGRAEVDVVRVVKTFVAAGDEDVKRKAAELHAAIDKAAAESDRRKRVDALAALGNAGTVLLIAVLVATLALPRVAWADTAPASAPTSRPVTGLLEGDVAPFDGLLVPPDTYKRYLHQRIDLEACELRVKVRDKAIADHLAMPLLPVPTTTPKLGSGSFGWWFTAGVATGFLVAGAVVWGAVQVLRAEP